MQTIPLGSFQDVGLERHCLQPHNSLGESEDFFIPTILLSSFSSSSIMVIVFLFSLFLFTFVADLANGLRETARRFSGTLLKQVGIKIGDPRRSEVDAHSTISEKLQTQERLSTELSNQNPAASLSYRLHLTPVRYLLLPPPSVHCFCILTL